jgi:hypothetical protein
MSEDDVLELAAVLGTWADGIRKRRAKEAKAAKRK